MRASAVRERARASTARRSSGVSPRSETLAGMGHLRVVKP
jgi:hypothetical protein